MICPGAGNEYPERVHSSATRNSLRAGGLQKRPELGVPQLDLDAATNATTTIPILLPATSSDPVAMGLVSSLSRPDGNVTGSTTFGPEIMAKRLELLKEVM